MPFMHSKGVSTKGKDLEHTSVLSASVDMMHSAGTFVYK